MNRFIKKKKYKTIELDNKANNNFVLRFDGINFKKLRPSYLEYDKCVLLKNIYKICLEDIMCKYDYVDNAYYIDDEVYLFIDIEKTIDKRFSKVISVLHSTYVLLFNSELDNTKVLGYLTNKSLLLFDFKIYNITTIKKFNTVCNKIGNKVYKLLVDGINDTRITNEEKINNVNTYTKDNISILKGKYILNVIIADY